MKVTKNAYLLTVNTIYKPNKALEAIIGNNAASFELIVSILSPEA